MGWLEKAKQELLTKNLSGYAMLLKGVGLLMIFTTFAVSILFGICAVESFICMDYGFGWSFIEYWPVFAGVACIICLYRGIKATKDFIAEYEAIDGFLKIGKSVKEIINDKECIGAENEKV